jgi:E3 ubiquitin-protein ligase SHPRH
MQPVVGEMFRRALGRKDDAVPTVDEVLDWMMDQNYATIRNHQRALLSSKLERGQGFENSPRVREALAIWDEAVREASEIVRECREILLQESAKTPKAIEDTTDGTSDTAGKPEE